MSENQPPNAALKLLVERIHNDLGRVGTEALHLKETQELLLNPGSYNTVVLYRIVEAAGSELHAFYTGVEKIIERLVEHKTGSLPGGKSSHSDLLRIAKENTLITEAHHTFLRSLSGVRHVIRHAYGSELDVEALKSAVSATLDAWPSLRDSFRHHLQILEGQLIG